MHLSRCIPVGILLLVIGCAAQQNDEVARLQREVAQLRSLTDPPPASLDDLYPPRSPAPAFQISMFAMETPFAGMVIDLQRGDLEGARAHFERFKAAYVEASGMVPEWAQSYPMGPVDELGAALEMGEQERVMPALEGVGGVCHHCHATTMTAVQQRYHWEDFSDIAVTDPVAGDEVGFTQLMSRLSVSMQGVGIDLGQGRGDDARGHAAAFRARFQALKEACEYCHDQERAYFVDARIDALIDDLGGLLQGAAPDPGRVGALMQQIGEESCSRCHLVHLPAAFARARWAARNDGS